MDAEPVVTIARIRGAKSERSCPNEKALPERQRLHATHLTAQRSQKVAVGRAAHPRLAITPIENRPRRRSQIVVEEWLRPPSGSNQVRYCFATVGALRDLRLTSMMPSASAESDKTQTRV